MVWLIATVGYRSFGDTFDLLIGIEVPLTRAVTAYSGASAVRFSWLRMKLLVVIMTVLFAFGMHVWRSQANPPFSQPLAPRLRR